jgi:DNA-binding XRE family transcriptional regulator
MKFIDRIKQLREERQIPQRELAYKALGIAKQNIKNQ